MPGQLGRLAAEDRAAGRAAHVGGALDELDDLLGVDRVGGDVVEEEQRLGARREDVVDPVRGEIGAAPAQPAGSPAEDELRADGVGRGREQPLVVDREQTGKGAEGSRRPPDVRVASTASRSRSTIASAVASETPAAAYVCSSGGTRRA